MEVNSTSQVLGIVGNSLKIKTTHFTTSYMCVHEEDMVFTISYNCVHENMVFTTSYNCVHEEDMVFTIILFQFQCMTGACSWLPDLRCTVRLRLKMMPKQPGCLTIQ